MADIKDIRLLSSALRSAQAPVTGPNLGRLSVGGNSFSDDDIDVAMPREDDEKSLERNGLMEKPK